MHDFNSTWFSIKPCDEQQADYISMKIDKQRKICNECPNCIGPRCDIFTSAKEEATLGKYLIEKYIS